METRLSTKGQVVLPGPIRRRLGLQTGDSLDATVMGGGVLLTPRSKRARKLKIVTDPVSGLPALSAGTDATLLTSEQVRELMDEFP
jgi:AbrB family looped-hinge helix DNA binding protein